MRIKTKKRNILPFFVFGFWFLKKIFIGGKWFLYKIRNFCVRIFVFSCGLFLREQKIIFMIDGGLGSQMWQYAIGQAIEKKSRVSVYYDAEWYKYYGKDCSGQYNRNWELDSIFPSICVKKANHSDIVFYKKYLNMKYSATGTVNTFIEKIISSRNPRYLGEYYDNPRYFHSVEKYLRNQFIFNTKAFSEDTMKMAESIMNTPCAIALQVRRGDFVSLGASNSSEYFFDAVEQIKMLVSKNDPVPVVFFVFSNDIAFCTEMFSIRNEKFVFVDINDNDRGSEDMYLMSLCRHFIISASSFGWWSAFLSIVDMNKIVITPKIWRHGESHADRGRMLLDGWMGL